MATPKYPPVKLDWTLHDMYALDGGDPQKVALVTSGPIPYGSVASSLPANTKYVYQCPGAPQLGKGVYARIGLGNGTQNHYFAAGPMDVYLFDIDNPKYDVENDCVESPPSHQTDALRVYDCLVPEQRPKVHFIARHDEFKAGDGVFVNPYPPMDFLDAHPTVVDQEVHYGLLSKRDLALSDLPSPATKVIEGLLTVEEVQDEAKVEAEICRFMAAFRSEPLPFVLKFPQSSTGTGVWILRDEQQREAKMELLKSEVGSMVYGLTPDNQHLNVVSLLFQQLVVDGRTNNLFFFITPQGRAVFGSCCEQILDEQGRWQASTIDYECQEELEKEFRSVMEMATAHVYKKGFTGAMGIDVMTDKDGKQLVVDMNVRLPGDCFMAPLKSHFQSRGMRYSACIPTMAFEGDRDSFESLFVAELESGQLIIVGWCRGKVEGVGSTYSICSFIIGGKNAHELLLLGKRIMAAGLPRPL